MPPHLLGEPVVAGQVCVPVTDAPSSRLAFACDEQDSPGPLAASFVAPVLST
ncbi:hypothetical protein [Streptomyces sp. MMG1121]|uniref:hypothetical protein n=1 Tax=Streptomyces sp. MMG1121 TaxID=1415544 RepID=UPI00131E381F|nr:hypothetical protein [Streptomyces sp. MMG1121]